MIPKPVRSIRPVAKEHVLAQILVKLAIAFAIKMATRFNAWAPMKMTASFGDLAKLVLMAKAVPVVPALVLIPVSSGIRLAIWTTIY
jgi:hypothetical protein